MKAKALAVSALIAIAAVPSIAVLAQSSGANSGAAASADPMTLTTPKDVRITSVSSTEVTLAWDIAREAGVKHYSIDRCEGERERCMFFKVVGTSKTKTFTDSDLNPGSTYNYRVQAIAPNLPASYSDATTVTTPESDAAPASSKDHK
ncbi:fibronectin type III domain-containing protein [Pseudoxanthomonas putridarboris]|uniref:Fibronectin type III domain-containing protein n=1 Tax=Pseudoxanthomonas putridarboris TaxID=752605 RepID=A0ABU9IVR0_9GAMM